MKKATLFALAFMLVGAGLYFYGGPAYRHYKEKRLLTQAKHFAAIGDFRNALLSARQTLQLNSANLEACGIMANLAECSRSPALLDWRRRIAELAPTIENKLLLAASALRIQASPYPMTQQILKEVASAAKDVPAYHLLSAELALKSRDLLQAEAEFQEASRLEPADQQHQFNLAVLRLQSTNAAVSAEACATLERLRSNTNLGPIALRWLIAGRLGERELAAAARLSRELVSDGRATVEDRLQYLNILERANKPELEGYLAVLQRSSLSNAAEVYALSDWMAGHGRAEAALQWLTNCPAKLRAEQPAPIGMVECYIAKKDWTSLEAFLNSEKWGELEFLRLAFLSRAAGEQKRKQGADALWRQAVRAAGERFGPLATLLGLAANWERDQAKEDLLWKIAQHFPRERWAGLELGRLFQSAGNTRGLNKVCALMASYNSKDLFAKNNLAATSLLLKQDLPKAHELAKDIYSQRPQEPTIVSTYAYSLQVQGRTKEALDIFQTLKREELQQPSIALYYGALLSATGETNKAEGYLEIAKVMAATFLPEERALIPHQ